MGFWKDNRQFCSQLYRWEINFGKYWCLGRIFQLFAEEQVIQTASYISTTQCSLRLTVLTSACNWTWRRAETGVGVVSADGDCTCERMPGRWEGAVWVTLEQFLVCEPLFWCLTDLIKPLRLISALRKRQTRYINKRKATKAPVLTVAQCELHLLVTVKERMFFFVSLVHALVGSS